MTPAKKIWTLGWGVLFVLAMTVLSQYAERSRRGTVPSWFCSKTAPAPTAASPVANLDGGRVVR
jgi:hypothetical protein